MNSTNWRNVAEIVGILSIVGSLLLVAYEIRQNSSIATADAVFAVNTVLDDSYRRLSENQKLNALVENGHADPSSLTDLEWNQFASCLHADMNVTEAMWFYYANGILDAEDLDGFRASVCGRMTTPGGREYWSRRAERFSMGFREAVDAWCFRSQ